MIQLHRAVGRVKCISMVNSLTPSQVHKYSLCYYCRHNSPTFFFPYHSVLSFHPLPLIWVPGSFREEQGIVGPVSGSRIHPAPSPTPSVLTLRVSPVFFPWARQQAGLAPHEVGSCHFRSSQESVFLQPRGTGPGDQEEVSRALGQRSTGLLWAAGRTLIQHSTASLWHSRKDPIPKEN